MLVVSPFLGNSNYFIYKRTLFMTSSITHVDAIFCLPSICVQDPEKPKNIVFCPWGHKNIYNGVAQSVWTLKRSMCLF